MIEGDSIASKIDPESTVGEDIVTKDGICGTGSKYDTIMIVGDHVAIRRSISTDGVVSCVVDIDSGCSHSVWRAVCFETQEITREGVSCSIHFDAVVEISMDRQTLDRTSTRTDQQAL